jgi:hypothetical protein
VSSILLLTIICKDQIRPYYLLAVPMVLGGEIFSIIEAGYVIIIHGAIGA